VAILVNVAMPVGVPIEMIDAVTEEMNAKADPPDGMIVHVTYVDGDRVRVVDVWETQAAFDEFNSTRLGPAVGKIAAQQGMEMGEPETVAIELHDVLRGR
jgi:hypothetical protein